jgi:signal transduction histidine kinase
LEEESPNISLGDIKAELSALEFEKESLMKVISHDLRSPLNKLFALVGLFKMSSETLTDEQLGYLNKMELVISDGLSRMRNLMDLRAVDGPGINTMYCETDITNLLYKVIGEHVPAAERKEIKISFDERPIIINTDKFSCLRIIDQLLSNAIKFSPLGSRINIDVDEKEEEVLIYIKDGGYGLSEEDQKNLYKKFVILTSRTTAGESSTGVGLYIAQKMAKNINGRILYSNSEGSVFTFSLQKTALA